MMSCDMKRIPNEKSPSRMPMSVIVIEVENNVALQIYEKKLQLAKIFVGLMGNVALNGHFGDYF